jgi:WD40 repeat protein
MVNSVAFHPSAPYLATGSRDGTAKLCKFEKIVEEVIRAPHVICSHTTDPKACKRAQRQALASMRKATPYFSLPLRQRLKLLGRTPSLMSQWGRRSFVSLLAKRLSKNKFNYAIAIQKRRKKLLLLDKVKQENSGGGRKSRKKKSSRKVKRHASKTKRYRKFR